MSTDTELGLAAAIALSEIHEYQTGAENNLYGLVNPYTGVGNSPALKYEPIYQNVEQRITAGRDSIKAAVSDLDGFLRSKLISTRYSELPADIRIYLGSFNQELLGFSRSLAEWAIHETDSIPWHIRLDQPVTPRTWLECPQQLHFLILFSGQRKLSANEDYYQRSLRFRLPGAKCCYEPAEQSGPDSSVIRFTEFSDQRKLLDIQDDPPTDFEPCELLRVLYEWAGLGWPQLALIRQIRVAFEDHGSRSITRSFK